MSRDDMELAGLVGRAINARDNPDALTAAVQAIVDWHENRWVRWLDVLEQHRAERRLGLLAEADDLERAIEARIAAHASCQYENRIIRTPKSATAA